MVTLGFRCSFGIRGYTVPASRPMAAQHPFQTCDVIGWKAYHVHSDRFSVVIIAFIKNLIWSRINKKKTRYVDGTPTSEVTRSLSGTSAHPTMVTQVNSMVMNGWLTSFSFIANRPPHSWDKAISDSDLETPRSRSWVWSKGKAIQSAQYHINSLPIHLTSIRPAIPEIELFRNLTLKHQRSRSWVRSKVKVTCCNQYPTNVVPFCFTSIGPTIPEIWP